MKRALAALAIAITITFMALPGGAMAETSASASMSFMSTYVWRGFTLSDSWAMQPSLDVASGNLDINYWSNIDGDTGEMNETDLTVKYSLPLESMSLDLGWIYYSLDSCDDSQELFVTAGFSAGPVSPYISLYAETDNYIGQTLVAGLDTSFEISGSSSIGLGAAVSYVNTDGYKDLHNGEVKLSGSFGVGGSVTISPLVAYSTSMSDAAKAVISGGSVDGENSVAYGGITVAVAFE